METAIKIIKLLLPAVVAGAAVLVKVRAGQLGVPLSLALLGGALLGWAVALVLEGTAALFGVRARDRSVGQRRLRQLERDKGLVLRSIKELEFDAKIQRLGEEETRALAAPLRQRATRLLREIDEARLEQPRGIDEQIEAELTRREAG